ncbi:NAD-dependent epimerase/dehydratase family protein, partial [bacterium]|nr:NAD-dependent epimerase/dehydratase family protein [bacterium]
RFLYASSAATYGSGECGYSDGADLATLRPLNMYGYSKHLFDLWMHRNGGLGNAVGIKFFNVWGPNEYHKESMRSMVVKAYEQIKSTGAVNLFRSYHPDYEDGKQMRDFLYVKDAVGMVLQLFENHSLHGIFNLGNGKTLTWIELISPIFTALKLEPEIKFIPMPEELRDKYQYFTKADMNRFLSTGCEQVQTPHAESIRDFVLNYLEKDAYLDVRSS